MLLRQFHLSAGHGSRLVCWLPDDPRLNLNTTFTIKELGDTEWRVVEKYKTVLKQEDINWAWHVGGL